MSEPIEPIDHDASNLEELLAQLDWAADTDHRKITVAEILIAVGVRQHYFWWVHLSPRH